MTNSAEIRWPQRFCNYRNALARLKEARDIVQAAVGMPMPDSSVQLLKEGLLQRFEFTQELAWKVMKDYMEYQGITDITGSRDAFRKALNAGLINDAKWMNSITDRKITSHAYDESEAGIIFDNVSAVYLPLFIEFESKMLALLNGQ